MNKKRLALLLFLISLCSFAVKADVAPDFGDTRVSVNLILEVPEDFFDYRFFLQSPIDIEEITLTKGEIKSFDSANRGGAKRFATLIAIPREEIDILGVSVFGKGESYVDPKWLHKEIQSKRFEGVIELVRHSFQKDISMSEKSSWRNPVYRLERDGLKGIKATLLQSGGTGVSFGFYEVKKSYTPLAIGLMIGGGFISAAVLLLGIWLFRRKRRNLV